MAVISFRTNHVAGMNGSSYYGSLAVQQAHSTTPHDSPHSVTVTGAAGVAVGAPGVIGAPGIGSALPAGLGGSPSPGAAAVVAAAAAAARGERPSS